MPKIAIGGHTVDARPDRVDFRDFEYRPPLRSLPRAFPDYAQFSADIAQYCADGMVLQQGRYGACTGFGLSAVINYLRWEAGRLDWRAGALDARGRLKPKAPKWANATPRVSPGMLYLNARVYDEWEGEDYEGSSCRGALKGWHKHGVCRETDWPYDADEGPLPPVGEDWRVQAPQVVLGAYFRIDAHSLVEMQAAIHEIHAIYVAAQAHDGWTRLGKVKEWGDARIAPPSTSERGGHAFALVGYTGEGFIVQNSWGPDWGWNGFALLPYADWIENGYDAWALALGAPLDHVVSPVLRSGAPLQARARVSGPAAGARLTGWFFADHETKRGPELPAGVAPWSEDDVARRVLVSSIGGAPVVELQNARDARENVALVAETLADDIARLKARDLALVIHGGLNGRVAGLTRAGFVGPWLHANGMPVVFPVWQTDAVTSMLHALADSLGLADLWRRLAATSPGKRPPENALDRAIEGLARTSPARPAWNEMKRKAQGLSERGGALHMLLNTLAGRGAKPRIHLVGHSAGAIVAGHALRMIGEAGLELGTVTLHAPACTVGLALETFGAALADGRLSKGALRIDHLSEERELADACIERLGLKLYSKSLLHLVCRALEDQHKTPILGMETALTCPLDELEKRDLVHRDHFETLEKWRKVSDGKIVLQPWSQEKIIATRRPKGDPLKNVTRPNVHGAFDNNVECMDATLAAMLGRKPKVAIDDLDYGGD